MTMELGNVEASEQLIRELYIDLRKRINIWAAVTKQTAQARMGYVGQHLVSIATGYAGGRSGARGKDLVISPDRHGEIKTCYRVDQLGKCTACGASAAAIELECSECGSDAITRKDDSKWLISIRHDAEYAAILDPEIYYFVLFDFTDLQNPHTVRASIWAVDTLAPGFALCMVDYFENIRSQSKSKAPLNLWPYQMKFELMRPRLIYQSFIYADDTIETTIFPGRDASPDLILPDLSTYSRARNLTAGKLFAFSNRLGLDGVILTTKKSMIGTITEKIADLDTKPETIFDALARSIYWDDIAKKIPNLPDVLQAKLAGAGLIE